MPFKIIVFIPHLYSTLNLAPHLSITKFKLSISINDRRETRSTVCHVDMYLIRLHCRLNICIVDLGIISTDTNEVSVIKNILKLI